MDSRDILFKTIHPNSITKAEPQVSTFDMENILLFEDFEIPNEKPEEPYLSDLLETILNETCVSEELRSMIFEKTSDEKWSFILTIYSQAKDLAAPKDLYSGLMTKCDVELLKRISFTLHRAPLYWIRSFLNIGGHVLLFIKIVEFSKLIRDKTKIHGREHVDILQHLLLVMSELLNTRCGLESMSQIHDPEHKLVYSIIPSEQQLSPIIFRMLCILIIVNQNSSSIIDALQNLSDYYGLSSPFAFAIDAIRGGDPLWCFAFLNVVLYDSKDIQTRASRRFQMLKIGLNELLGIQYPEDVQNQVDEFISLKKQDESEIMEVFGCPCFVPGDIESSFNSLFECSDDIETVSSFILELIYTKNINPENYREYIDLMINFLTALHHSTSDQELLKMSSEIWSLAPLNVSTNHTMNKLEESLSTSTGFISSGSISISQESPSINKANEESIMKLDGLRKQVNQVIEMKSIPRTRKRTRSRSPSTAALLKLNEEDYKSIFTDGSQSCKSVENNIEHNAPLQKDNLLLTKTTIIPPPPPPPPPPPTKNAAPPPPPPPPNGPKLSSRTNPDQNNVLNIHPNLPPPKKMKQIFWERLPDPMREKSIWNVIDDLSMQIDQKTFVEQFQASEIKKSIVEKEQIKEKPKIVSLVSPDKNQAVCIALKTIKLTGHQIASQLITMSDQISLDHLGSLKKCIPSPDDYSVIDSYTGPHELLGVCEQFFLAIKPVPMLQLRIDLMLHPNVDEEIMPFMSQMSKYLNALIQIRESKSLNIILSVILRYGNYLNGGSQRGGAYGFKIDLLTKLRDTKSSIPSLSFLHLIVHIIMEEYPECVNIINELSDIEEASCIDIDILKESMQIYINILAQCLSSKNGMEKLLCEDKLKVFAQKYIVLAQPLCDEFLKQIDIAQKDFKLIAASYNDESMKSSEFFGIFKQFLSDFRSVKQDLNDNMLFSNLKMNSS